MFDLSIQIGQHVRNVSTGEVGIVVHLWIDPETGAEDELQHKPLNWQLLDRGEKGTGTYFLGEHAG